MKVLFLSEYLMQKEECGGKRSATIHYEIIVDLVGRDNVDAIVLHHYGNSYIRSDHYMFESYKNKIQALANVLAGNSRLISNRIIKEVVKMVKEKQYDAVFVDNRILADVLPSIKKVNRNIKIITNFHGISKYTFWENIILRKKWWQMPVRLGDVNSEKKAARYSDVCCFLNQRDLEHFKKYYGIRSHVFLPSVLSDIYNPADIDCAMKYDDFNLLFVGGYFEPNNEGIVWFVRNVIPKLDIRIQLYVVGNHIERVVDEFKLKQSENVHFIGFVKDLNPWYQCANIAIGPIFSGDGMKTKTAEALMFGKVVVASKEALVGYENITGYECNAEEDFVKIISMLYADNLPKFNLHNRSRYLEEFSVEAQKKAIMRCLHNSIESLMIAGDA